MGGSGSGSRVFLGCLLLLFAMPVAANAQQRPPPNEPDTVRREEVTIDAICVTDGPGALVRALSRLRASPRAATSVAERLLGCVDGTTESSRAMLIVNFLEAVRRTDLLRLAILRNPEPAALLRAQVALANIEGDYGALALAIGEAVHRNAPVSEIRHALSYLRPPSERARSEVEVRGREALRAWLEHLGVLEGSVWARVDREEG